MADNFTIFEEDGVTIITIAAKDIGGVHHTRNLITDETGADAFGAVTASPTANTLLARIKALETALAGSLSVDGATVTTDMGNDYTRQLGRTKVVNDAGDVVDPVAQVAHDAPDSGEPVKFGGKAVTAISAEAAVANDDRTDALFTTSGLMINNPWCAPGDEVDGMGTATGTANTSVITAQGAGIVTKVMAVIIANSSDVNVDVDINDGSTSKMTFTVPGASTAGIVLPVPVTGTANTAWNFQSSDAATTITCTLIGFKAKV